MDSSFRYLQYSFFPYIKSQITFENLELKKNYQCCTATLKSFTSLPKHDIVFFFLSIYLS